MSFLAMDPPPHTRMRSLVGKVFTIRRVADLEPRIRDLAVRYLDEAVAMGSFDMVGDFAGKLPMDVISEMIGVPPADRAELRRLADLLVHREDGVLDVPQEGMEAALALAGYFADMVRERRGPERDDLTSGLVHADLDGEQLSDDDVISVLFLMVVAGNETTTKLLGNAWYWAWRYPDQKAQPLRMRGGPRLGGGDAALRHLVADARSASPPAPSSSTARRSRDGERVLLLVGSANRDGAVFPDPDRYDLDRDTAKLISFGGGRHFCLGAPLARLEARVALEELVRPRGGLRGPRRARPARPLHQRAGLRQPPHHRHPPLRGPTPCPLRLRRPPRAPTGGGDRRARRGSGRRRRRRWPAPATP